MDVSQLHFTHPMWLWGTLAIPLIWVAFFLFYRENHPFHQLEKFIDRHLLPYLLIDGPHKKTSVWKTLLLWSTVWIFLNLALAGPRWTFREIETFSRDQSLVILLDLSESMNTADIKPSRLIRAKQKIEDLLNLSKGVKIGLIAFAADPHMITPLTDDIETIRHLLPSLTTDLVHIQGSRLSSALEMASLMLEAEPGNNKALLVISDGGFEDASAITTAKKLAEKGFIIHAMGVGTHEGAPLQDHQKNVIKKNGAPILSKLEKEKLSEINRAGNGRYLELHYSDQEEAVILRELEKRADAQIDLGKKRQLWDEHFYLFILPVLPIFLWWFRRGYVFAAILIFFTPTFSLEAIPFEEYFKNSEELGKEAVDDGRYQDAIHSFQDPYRKGVAHYKAGNFSEAEEMFRQSSRLDVASHAAYNLGNALAQQQKLKEAVTAYEEVLKKWPDHTRAKENLELVKKMMKEEENSDSENSNPSENQDKRESPNQEENESQNHSDQKKQPQKPSQDQDDVKDIQKEKEPETEEVNSQPKQNDRSPDSQTESREEKRKQMEPLENTEKESQEDKASRSEEDQDADLWLNRIVNDPKTFLKNKFYIESKRNGITEGVDPW